MNFVIHRTKDYKLWKKKLLKYLRSQTKVNHYLEREKINCNTFKKNISCPFPTYFVYNYNSALACLPVELMKMDKVFSIYLYTYGQKDPSLIEPRYVGNDIQVRHTHSQLVAVIAMASELANI